eukprot:6208883-Pleurochrysis_carterae.AAC.1
MVALQVCGPPKAEQRRPASCEAELVAASKTAKEAVHLRAPFDELGLLQPEPTTMPMDNKRAIDLAYNPDPHQRTKHND